MSGQAATQSPTSIRGAFDPGKHLTRVNGSEYLPVAQRLAWLRDQHPDAVLTTDLVEILPEIAIFRAEVRLPSGGCATGYGSESPDDFRDYLEKAETKAIGRALAVLGFGTQFCQDHDDGAPRRPADAPAPMRRDDHPRSNERRRTDGPEPMSQRQQQYLEQVAHAAGLDLNALDALAIQRFRVPYLSLNRNDCSALITALQRPQP